MENKEIENKFLNIFFNYMADKGVKETRKFYADEIKECMSTVDICHKVLQEDKLEANEAIVMKEHLNYLYQALKHLQSSNMEYQKELYKKTQRTNFCRSVVQIPLKRKISSRYNDLLLEVVFYDDVCTPQGKYEEYIKIKDKNKKIEFLKDNIEITNIGLAYEKNNRRVALIEVIGTLKWEEKVLQQIEVQLLGREFADLNNLSKEYVNYYEFKGYQHDLVKKWLLNKLSKNLEEYPANPLIH